MFLQNRHQWFTARNQTARSLRFEPLEDRRLLSITVNTLADENNGIGVGGISLREAIAAVASGDTINFSVAGTITLTHGQLTINKALTIDGPGADLLTIDASGNDPTPSLDNGDGSRAVFVSDGLIGSPLNIEINGVTIAGGDVTLDGGGIENHENLHIVDTTIQGNAATRNGGGIFTTNGTLVLSTVTVANNRAQDGGGLYNIGNAQVFNGEIRNNHAAAGGGGISNSPNGQLLLSETTLSGNTATDGGAIMNSSADFTVVGSSLTGNTATHSGGGLRNTNGTGTAFGSTLSGNTAQYGGGVYVDTALAKITTISNSTISGNTATDGGGGIYNFLGHTIIQFSTIANNRADLDRGGGVVSWGDPNATFTEVRSSIIAKNVDANGDPGTDIDIVGGPLGGPFDSVQSNGYNLLGFGSANHLFHTVGDLTEADPMLAPLADNGGPRQTMALLLGSPAIDAGNPSAVAGVGIVPTADERGGSFSRVLDGDNNSVARIDIGAFESDAPYFLVDTLEDENNGIGVGAGTSLREAINAANLVNSGTPGIFFDPSITAQGSAEIVLSLGQLLINNDVVINGPGAESLTIDGAGASRVFFVDDPNGEDPADVVIAGLTLTGGHDLNGGGAIFSNARLTVRDAMITGNQAQWGGGIYNNAGGDLTVLHSTITGNSAISPGVPMSTGSGGGIYNWGGSAAIVESTISSNNAPDAAGIRNANYGYMLIDRSEVDGNVAQNSGGGIRNDAGFVTISSSSVSGNSAGTDGGGIYTFYGGTLSISKSTISSNSAGGVGGGIDNRVTLLSITSSTIDHNYAGGSGGGLYLITGLLGVENNTISNSTISGNSAGVTVGGIGVQVFANDTLRIANSTITGNITNTNPLIPNPEYNGGGIGVRVNSFGIVELSNTIVAGNTWHGAARDDVSGAIVAQFSLIGDNTGATITNNGGNQIGTGSAPINPLLGPLANNGGPTRMHALLQGSSAIDAGDPSAIAGDNVPAFDQRGTPFERIRDGNATLGAVIDIGAFEVQQYVATPALLGDYNLNHVVDAADYTVWRDKLGASVTPYSGADGNGNGVIDTLDYNVWRSHFGMSIPGSGLGSSSLALPSPVVVTSSETPVADDDAASTALSQAPLQAPASKLQTTRPVETETLNAGDTHADNGLLAWLSSFGTRRRALFDDHGFEPNQAEEAQFLDQPSDCVFATLGVAHAGIAGSANAKK